MRRSSALEKTFLKKTRFLRLFSREIGEWEAALLRILLLILLMASTLRLVATILWTEVFPNVL